MLLRALLAFVALPGIVAFAVPAILSWRSTLQPGPLGISVFAAGLAVLLWCVGAFYVVGKGTLASWSPPRKIVTVGLYRLSRNPMYVGVLLVITGWALLFRSPLLAGYAAAVALVFHLQLLLHEEPWLARTFGDEWAAYRKRVPRWIGLPWASR